MDPLAGSARRLLAEEELRCQRESSPWNELIPVARTLLLGENVRDCGALFALGDADGRLLWVEGDHHLRSAAESMRFMPGTDWSEAAVGTSAPSTALALGHPVRVHHDEHFLPAAHTWSCLAVPLRDPETGVILGVLDLTDRAGAIRGQGERLLIAAAHALQQEILVRRLRAAAAASITAATAPGPAPAPELAPVTAAARPQPAARIAVLGHDLGVLNGTCTEVLLSARHAEILMLLAWHPRGLTAEQLADQLYESEAPLVTLRAEIVRLRRVLERAGGPVLESRPYRLEPAWETDVHRVLALLDRGAHRQALAAFSGDILPSSHAPGVVSIREQVRGRLRESLLAGASVDTLLEYARGPHGRDDLEVWETCLRLLPACSPRRTAVLREIERIEAELDIPVPHAAR